MNKKRLRDHCWRVYNYFNNIECRGSEVITRVRGCDRCNEIYSFCTEITGGNFPKIEKFENEHEEELEEEGGYPLSNLCAVAFALGFAFSQMFEVPYPKFRKEIEIIGRGLREMNILPYLPRERKTA